MSPYTSRSQTSSVTDHRLINLSTMPYDQKDLSVFCRTYTSVELLPTKPAGPLKRPSPSTIASLHDITGSFTSCYKSHRLQTRLRLLHNVVLLTRLQCRSKFFHYSVESLLAVDLWRHHLVMILWLNSQQNRFCDASKRVRPLISASDLRWIYITII